MFFQAEDGIRDVERSRGLGDVYKRQESGDEQFGLQDVDIEMGSDNEENLYDDKVVEGRD